MAMKGITAMLLPAFCQACLAVEDQIGPEVAILKVSIINYIS